MTETAKGHAELVERVIEAIRAADEAWFIEHHPETPAEKIRQWTADLHDNFRAVAEAAIAATLSPIAAHGTFPPPSAANSYPLLVEALTKLEQADEGLANAYSATHNDYDKDRLACERIGLQKAIKIARAALEETRS